MLLRKQSAMPKTIAVKRKVRRDFFNRRLSVVGLARKYGLTVPEIEEMLRRKR
jgi:hypothetical protein